MAKGTPLGAVDDNWLSLRHVVATLFTILSIAHWERVRKRRHFGAANAGFQPARRASHQSKGALFGFPLRARPAFQRKAGLAIPSGLQPNVCEAGSNVCDASPALARDLTEMLYWSAVMTMPKPALYTPTFAKGGHRASSSKHRQNSRSNGEAFIMASLNMTWQLAIVVLVPILGGYKLDRMFHTLPAFTAVGFVLAMTGMGLVLWRQIKLFTSEGVPPEAIRGAKKQREREAQVDDE